MFLLMKSALIAIVIMVTKKISKSKMMFYLLAVHMQNIMPMIVMMTQLIQSQGVQ